MKTQTIFTEDYILLQVILHEPVNLKDQGVWKNLAYKKLNTQATDLDLPLLPNWYKSYWIATVRFKDGTELTSKKFYEYDTGVKKWSSEFSYNLQGKIESIDIEKLTDWNENIENLFSNEPKPRSWFGCQWLCKEYYIKGFKKAQELSKYKLFTSEDVEKAFEEGWRSRSNMLGNRVKDKEKVIQQLQQSKLPKEFIPKLVQKSVNGSIPVGQQWNYELKTIDTPQGKQVVGEWIF